MKQLWHMIERYYPWLLLLLGVDCFCAVILWISDIQVFQTLIGLVVLTSILLFSAILFVLNKRENTHMELFRDFLSDPTICNADDQRVVDLAQCQHAGVLAVGGVGGAAQQTSHGGGQTIAHQGAVQAWVIDIVVANGGADGGNIANVLHHGSQCDGDNGEQSAEIGRAHV